MYIAIDDTYGNAGNDKSLFVTKNRKTHIAVMFEDREVTNIREQLTQCLAEVSSITSLQVNEFHFVDIYNKNPPWDKLHKDQESLNLGIFEFFAEIYRMHRWPVLIQTVDDITLQDFKSNGFEKILLNIPKKSIELDLKKRDDISLLLLLLKIKAKLRANQDSINLLIDEGRKKPKSPFGYTIFKDWPKNKYHGEYKSSREEPLLQIADFIAFCINRSTHVSLKDKKTLTDEWFLNLVGTMNINSEDLTPAYLKSGFSYHEIDRIHETKRSLL